MPHSPAIIRLSLHPYLPLSSARRLELLATTHLPHSRARSTAAAPSTSPSSSTSPYNRAASTQSAASAHASAYPEAGPSRRHGYGYSRTDGAGAASADAALSFWGSRKSSQAQPKGPLNTARRAEVNDYRHALEMEMRRLKGEEPLPMEMSPEEEAESIAEELDRSLAGLPALEDEMVIERKGLRLPKLLSRNSDILNPAIPPNPTSTPNPVTPITTPASSASTKTVASPAPAPLKPMQRLPNGLPRLLGNQTETKSAQALRSGKAMDAEFEMSGVPLEPLKTSATSTSLKEESPAPPSTSDGPRRNPVGVQLLSSSLHRQLFPGKPLPQPPKSIIDISLRHLSENELSPSGSSTAPEISFDMPALRGKNIREHFEQLGRMAAEPYLSLSKACAEGTLPAKPAKWVLDRAGWTRYGKDGSVTEVPDLGDEQMIVFDVETMYLKSDYAVMATAATPNAWYSWLSPALFAEPGEVGEDGKRRDWPSMLIPLTKSGKGEPAVIVGHNVGYDRQRVLEEYNLEVSNNRWLDTMSLHVATRGITSVQRPAWLKNKKDKAESKVNREESHRLLTDLEQVYELSKEAGGEMEASATKKWQDVTAANSLAAVAELHCGIKLSKEVRNRFGDPHLNSATEFLPDLEELLNYCASDVETTHAVLGKVLPLFLKSCPHPTSFAGPLTMGNSFLPIDNAWAQYLKNTEDKYNELEGGVKAVLWELAYKLKKRGPVEGDPWSEQLDWTPKTARWGDDVGFTGEGQAIIGEQPKQEAVTADGNAVETQFVPVEGVKAADPLPEAEVVEARRSLPASLPASPEPEPLPAESNPPSHPPISPQELHKANPGWEMTLAQWTEAGSSASTKMGDVLPYILQTSFAGYPLVEVKKERWVIRVPISEKGDPRLAEFGSPLNLEWTPFVDSENYVYFRPTLKQRVATPFGQARAKEWKKGLFQSPFPDLVQHLVAGQSRLDSEAEIKEAASLFRAGVVKPIPVQRPQARAAKAPVVVAPPPVAKPTPPRPKPPTSKNPFFGQWPQWFWDLTSPASQAAPGELRLTVRAKIAPLLLRMQWKGHPLYSSREHGWTYRQSREDVGSGVDGLVFSVHRTDHKLRDDEDGVYFKVPHHAGNDANVGNPLAKNFLPYIANKTLASAESAPGDPDGDIASAAQHAMEMSAQCSYWTGARERILGQMAVYDETTGSMGFPTSEDQQRFGMILPQVITMGTVTRRAVENTWLTASNAKKNRVGSELKAMIRAPPGYAIVGADVDSEELWIASVLGDAQFGMHGGSAIGWMTLEGTKSAGTDLHSKTAKILGTSRDHAKVFNYSRIYGAGVRHAMQLLIQSNPKLPAAEADQLANNLYKATKGRKAYKEFGTARQTQKNREGSGYLWQGGSESYLFNTLEAIAYSKTPRTPALGCGVTDALKKEYLSTDGPFGSDYLPSRINWVVQSSGVDYLHLLIVSMEYLIKRYGIRARYMISVHDEVRYMVKEEDRYRAALALQVANAWTRALLCFNLGLDDLPQGVAFFSAVDIDNVFRKEVDMPCVTPSQPVPLPAGESLGIEKLLEVTKGDLGPVVEESEDQRLDSQLQKNEVFPAPDFSSPRHRLFLEAQASKKSALAKRYLQG